MTMVVDRERMLPTVHNPSYDEEPYPNQPVIYETTKLERERRASVVTESPYHMESDCYLNVTGEDPGVSSI